MVKQIPLQNGMCAFVDDEDFQRVNEFIWTIKTGRYGNFEVMRRNGKKNENLSHFILNKVIDINEVISFKNKNDLDFRKENLEIVTKQIKAHKSSGQKNTSSKYKGVSWIKRDNKWRANIRVSGKLISLGHFVSEDDAAFAYNIAALKYFGEHAFQNVIGEDNSSKPVLKEKVVQRRTNPSKKYSKYHGVSKFRDKWRADISGKYLGLYTTEIEAAKAYNKAAEEKFGDNAILNDI